MPLTITQTSTLMCPHGGQVQIIPSQQKVMAGGAPVSTKGDTFVIVGCPFMIGTKPSPCVKVQWVVTDLKTTVSGQATLSQGSTGLCLSPENAPQGPVTIVQTQPKASTS